MPASAPEADLFAEADAGPERIALAPGAVLLRGFARDEAPALIEAAWRVAAIAPFRHMVTPGGFTMSAAMTNCGTAGWVSDRRGYRYDGTDPETGLAWPAMPDLFRDLAARAAAEAGYEGFEPDACLINRYTPGTRLTLHQDKNERDVAAPIVSVSLGLPATFLFGGAKRTDRAQRLRLVHGDVAVWGGASRLAFHGIAPLAEGEHALTSNCRINLTLRKAL